MSDGGGLNEETSLSWEDALIECFDLFQAQNTEGSPSEYNCVQLKRVSLDDEGGLLQSCYAYKTEWYWTITDDLKENYSVLESFNTTWEEN